MANQWTYTGKEKEWPLKTSEHVADAFVKAFQTDAPIPLLPHPAFWGKTKPTEAYKKRLPDGKFNVVTIDRPPKD